MDEVDERLESTLGTRHRWDDGKQRHAGAGWRNRRTAQAGVVGVRVPDGRRKKAAPVKARLKKTDSDVRMSGDNVEW